MACVIEYWRQMNTVQRNIFYGYFAGMVLHSAVSAYREAVRSLLTYKENKSREVQTTHHSEFDAFWSGFRWALWTRLGDSLFWPVKFISFGIFLVYRNDM